MPGHSGAEQWLDFIMQYLIKQESNRLKTLKLAQNWKYEDDMKNNNNIPICHTAGRKRKALDQAQQAKIMVETMENVKEMKVDWTDALRKTGYLIEMEKTDNDKLYLSHLNKNNNDNLSQLRGLRSLAVNPITATNSEILNLKCKPGRKPTNIGTNSRLYSRGQTPMCDKLLRDRDNGALNESNIDQHFGIIRRIALATMNKIEKDLKLPAKHLRNEGKYYVGIYNEAHKYNFIKAYEDIYHAGSNDSNNNNNNDGKSILQITTEEAMAKLDRQINESAILENCRISNCMLEYEE